MPKYLIRLDDACQQANWPNWHRIENILNLYGIKPIVAVIADNKDPNLKYIDKGHEYFWSKVSEWSKNNWAIGMHGYRHIYETKDAGIVPISNKSEFAGLSLNIQKEKIKLAWEIFNERGIKPNLWVAPSHSFDKNTLIALSKETDINIISDGISFDVFYDKGFYWIPQQLWSIKKMLLGKIWTICLHPNTMTEYEIDNIEKKIKNLNLNFIDIQKIDFIDKKKSTFDILFEKIFFPALFFKRLF